MLRRFPRGERCILRDELGNRRSPDSKNHRRKLVASIVRNCPVFVTESTIFRPVVEYVCCRAAFLMADSTRRPDKGETGTQVSKVKNTVIVNYRDPFPGSNGLRPLSATLAGSKRRFKSRQVFAALLLRRAPQDRQRCALTQGALFGAFMAGRSRVGEANGIQSGVEPPHSIRCPGVRRLDGALDTVARPAGVLVVGTGFTNSRDIRGQKQSAREEENPAKNESGLNVRRAKPAAP